MGAKESGEKKFGLFYWKKNPLLLYAKVVKCYNKISLKSLFPLNLFMNHGREYRTFSRFIQQIPSNTPFTQACIIFYGYFVVFMNVHLKIQINNYKTFSNSWS